MGEGSEWGCSDTVAGWAAQAGGAHRQGSLLTTCLFFAVRAGISLAYPHQCDHGTLYCSERRWLAWCSADSHPPQAGLGFRSRQRLLRKQAQTGGQMLLSNALLQGDNTKIEAGGVKKSISVRLQRSKTRKLNPERAASRWQGWSGMQIEQALLLDQKSAWILLAGLSPEERKGKRGLSTH